MSANVSLTAYIVYLFFQHQKPLGSLKTSQILFLGSYKQTIDLQQYQKTFIIQISNHIIFD